MTEKTILFVDDEPQVLQGLKRMLRSRRDKWNMQFADSGEMALKILETNPADVVVSDMRMPKMDGAQLLANVRAKYPGAVRIILSGFSDDEAIYRTVGPAHQYIAKPCDAKVLIEAIERALDLRKFLNSKELQLLVAGIDRLPPLPDIFVELNDHLQDPNASANSIAKIISRDVAMAAQTMKLTNSAYFGLPVPVKSPLHAVQLLGFETIKALVLSVGIFSQFEGTSGNQPILRQLNERSNHIGALAKSIMVSEGADSHLADQACSAGALSHIGTLLLITHSPEEFKKAGKLAEKDGMNIVEAERQIFGTSHAELGAYLLGLWGFSDLIVEAVAFHHEPSRCSGKEVSLLMAVHAAQFLTHRHLDDPESQNPNAAAIDRKYFESLGYLDRLNHWQTLAMDLEVKGAAA